MVRDHVVQVPGDAQPFLHDPAPGLLVPVVLRVPGAFLDGGQVPLAAAYRAADGDGEAAPGHDGGVLRIGPAAVAPMTTAAYTVRMVMAPVTTATLRLVLEATV